MPNIATFDHGTYGCYKIKFHQPPTIQCWLVLSVGFSNLLAMITTKAKLAKTLATKHPTKTRALEKQFPFEVHCNNAVPMKM